MLFCHFQKSELSNSKITSTKSLMKNHHFYGRLSKFILNSTVLTKSYHVEILNSKVVALRNVFRILHESPFSLLIIISAGFYGDR